MVSLNKVTSSDAYDKVLNIAAAAGQLIVDQVSSSGLPERYHDLMVKHVILRLKKTMDTVVNDMQNKTAGESE